MLKTRLAALAIRWKGMKPIEAARYAKENTDFYRDYYKDCSMNSFEELPVMSKYNLTGVSPYSLLSREFKDSVFWYAETSGSSGSPTPSFLTARDFKGLIALSSLSPYMESVRREVKNNRTAVNGLTFGYTIAGFSFGMLMQKYKALVAQLGTRSTIALPERTAGVIVKLRPSMISATPLDFMAWMEIIRLDYPQQYERTADSLKFLLSTAEPCASSRQRQIERHFNLTHLNTYASVDGFVTIPCPCGEMHVIEGLNHIELYDEKMKCLGAKGTGRLCFTSLIRKTTPMVKYLLDDLVTVSDSNCPYGYRKSIRPHGRYELSLELKGRTWGNLDFEEIIYRHGLFMDYRVEISEGGVQVKVEEYPAARSNYDLKGLQDAFAGETGMKCSVELYPLGTLTECRRVREAKSIIKVLDKRAVSRQVIPKVL